MRTLNVPMDEEDYSSLSAKKEIVAKGLGVSGLTWRQFMFLMKECSVRTLVKAGKVLNYDSQESRSK